MCSSDADSTEVHCSASTLFSDDAGDEDPVNASETTLRNLCNDSRDRIAEFLCQKDSPWVSKQVVFVQPGNLVSSKADSGEADSTDRDTDPDDGAGSDNGSSGDASSDGAPGEEESGMAGGGEAKQGPEMDQEKADEWIGQAE